MECLFRYTLVINHYKSVTYRCAYFSESVDETSEAKLLKKLVL